MSIGNMSMGNGVGRLPACWAAVLTAAPPVLRLLHLFAARGLRWAAYAAAEILQVYRHLDIREHKGKVRAGGLDSWTEGRGAGGLDAWFSEGRGLGVQTDLSCPLQTPLLVAAAANQPLIVEDLLNLGAEPNAADHQGRSVLHVAATYGLPGVLSVWPAGSWGEWGGLVARILASSLGDLGRP